MTTLSVLGHVNNAEAKVWHRVENFAVDHPNAARLLSIAAAICKFVKHIFLPPVQFVENLILAGKSIRDYTRQTDQAEKNKCYDAFKSYLGDAVMSLLKTPFAPLVGAYYAITTLVSVTASPLKTAKIEAAEMDMYVYSENEKTPEKSRAAFAFASHAALARFETLVKSTNDNAEVAKLHFLDTQDAKDQTIAEMKLKMQKFSEASEAAQKKIKAQFEDLQKAKEELTMQKGWEILRDHGTRFDAFTKELSKADLAHAKDMVYNPNAPEAVAASTEAGNPTAVTQPASTSTTSEAVIPATTVEVQKPATDVQPVSTTTSEAVIPATVEVQKPATDVQPVLTSTTSEAVVPATTVEVQKPATDAQPVSIAPEDAKPTASELEQQRLMQLVSKKWQSDSATTNPATTVEVQKPATDVQPVSTTTSEIAAPATTVEVQKPATDAQPVSIASKTDDEIHAQEVSLMLERMSNWKPSDSRNC